MQGTILIYIIIFRDLFQGKPLQAFLVSYISGLSPDSVKPLPKKTTTVKQLFILSQTVKSKADGDLYVVVESVLSKGSQITCMLSFQLGT